MPDGFVNKPNEQEPVTQEQGNTPVKQGKSNFKFSAPVPGESLLAEPKSFAFERPPEFTNLEDATEFVWHKLTQPENAKGLFAQLDKGLPVEAIVRPILFSGFANGKWTPDLAALMIPPVMMMVQRFAEMGEFDNELSIEEFGKKMDKRVKIKQVSEDQ